MGTQLPASVLCELSWTRELSQGCIGPEVKRLQEWLALRGFGTSIDGDFGPATAAAVRRCQLKKGIPPFAGVASQAVLEGLSLPLKLAFSFDAPKYGALDLREAIARTAEFHNARLPREVGGDNRGPWVRAYCGADGSENRWCAGFALSIVRQAAESFGLQSPIPFTLSCDQLAESASKAHRLYRDPRSVREGDIFLERKDEGDWIHTGIVTAVHAEHFETIEGNTNDEGSANGYEVCARTRSFAGKDFILLN